MVDTQENREISGLNDIVSVGTVLYEIGKSWVEQSDTGWKR